MASFLYRFPAKSRLIYFHYKPAEKFIVVVYRKAIMIIVIVLDEGYGLVLAIDGITLQYDIVAPFYANGLYCLIK